MSPRFVSSRLADQIQRITESSSYTDTATLMAVVDPDNKEFDGYGQPVENGATTEIVCSFTDKPNMELWKNYGDIKIVHGEIRFKEPRPGSGWRVKITGRFDDGGSYTDALFEIIGIRDRGVFGFVCALKQVGL